MQLKNSLIFPILASSILGVGAFWFFQTQVEGRREAKKQEIAKTLQTSSDLIQRSHPHEALKLLKKSERDARTYPELEEQWVDLALQITKQLNNDQVLESLFWYDSNRVLQNEELSFRLAERALLQNQADIYEPILAKWYGYSGPQEREWKEKWLLLKADALATQGNAEKALSLLQAQKLQGDAEIARLLRLGLLHENEHPKVAFKYLTKALSVKPHDGELHFFRAKLLEDASKGDPSLRDLALSEYKQAIKKKPSDPLFKNELVGAYLSVGDLEAAYKFLESTSPLFVQGMNDEFHAGALFISHVYKPLPQGISRVLHFPEMSEKFGELVWLDVIEQLQAGQDKKAFEILELNPEISPFAPSLYNGLKLAIASRYPEISPPQIQPAESKKETLHSLFKQLQNPPISKETAALLKSAEGYAALFLAAGWFEAALHLHQLKVFPDTFPNWVAYGFTQSLAQNRGIEQALEFGIGQKPTPQLDLLIGELDLQKGNIEGAIKRLTKLVKSTTELGVKAAGLLTKLYASQGLLAKAKHTAEANSAFANSLAGQEAIARLALKMENPQEAEEIYTQILSQSAEAKSYFALKAFNDSDYATALQLTKELLQLYPQNKDLENQLALIQHAAKKLEAHR